MSIKKIADSNQYIKDDACRVKLFHTNKGWMTSAKHSLELGMISGAALMGGVFATHINVANADSVQGINVTVPHSNVDSAVSNAQSQKVNVTTGSAEKQADGTYKYNTSTKTENAINVSKASDQNQTATAGKSASDAENNITNDYKNEANQINSASDSAKKSAQDFENKQSQINKANQDAVNNYNATKVATDKNNATLKNDAAQAQKDGVQVTQNGNKTVSSADQANSDFNNNNKAIKDADAKQQQFNKDYQDAVNKNNSDKSAADNSAKQLDSAIDAAKKAGIKVNDSGSKDVNSLSDLQNDYNNQIKALNDAVSKYQSAVDAANKQNQAIDAANKAAQDDYNKKMADYNSQMDDYKKQMADYQAKLDQYNKDLADYKTKLDEYNKNKQNTANAQNQMQGKLNNSGVSTSDLNQQLSWNRSADATLTVQALNGANLDIQKINGADDQFDKNYVGWDSQYAYLIHNKSDSSINGDFLQATYSGNLNMSYKGKKIAKVVVTFSDLDNNGGNLNLTNHDSGDPTGKTNELTPYIRIGNDPTDNVWYGNCQSVIEDFKFYDENGNLINFDNDAYIAAGSLNAYNNHLEEAQLLSSGKAIALAGSNIGVYANNTLHSNGDQEDQSKWDKNSLTTGQAYYGAGIFQVSGDNVKIKLSVDRTYKSSVMGPDDTPDMKQDNHPGIWALIGTSLPVTPTTGNPPTPPTEPQKPTAPTEPQKPTLQNQVGGPAAVSIDVHHDNLKQNTPQLQHASVSYNLDTPADLVLQKNGTFTPSSVQYHYDNLTVNPSISKDVNAGIVQGEADSINGQNVVAGQSITFPLIQQSLPANRTVKYTKYQIVDKLDKNFDYSSFQSFLAGNKSQEDTSDWTPSLAKGEDGQYTLTLTANQSLLNAMNADLSKEFNFPIPDLYGNAINDGKAITNTYKVIASATDESGQHKDIVNGTYTSNTVSVHTTDTEKPVKEVDNENNVNINDKAVLPGDVLDYKVSLDLSELKDVAITPDTIAKKLGINDVVSNHVTVNGVSVEDASGKDVTSLFNISHDGDNYTINAKDPLSLIRQYGGTKLSVKFLTKVNDGYVGNITNVATQNTFGNLTKTNVVVNHVKKIDPKKDICINVGDEASLNGKDLQIGKTYSYVLDVSRPANYGGVTKQMDIVDHLPKQADFTGDVEIFSKGPITLADGEVLPKGDNITKFFNVSYDAATNTVTASPNAELLKALNLPENDKNAIEWQAYVQFIAKGYGKYVNTFEEIYNGKTVKSNTVVNNVPEPKKDEPKKETPQIGAAPKAETPKATPAPAAKAASQVGSPAPAQVVKEVPEVVQEAQPQPVISKQVGSPELPQTGDNEDAAIIGLAAAGLVGMLGMASLRKKED